MYKFLNSITAYSKDKKGLNIAVRIIYALFLLKMRKRAKYSDEMEALQRYNYRYLRDPITHRPYYFIKMLGVIPSAYFNPVATRRKAEKHLKKLKELPYEKSYVPFEVEIIPYEDLWEVVLEILGQKKSRHRNG